MKILILMDVFHTMNGAERLSVQLAEGLNRRPGMRADIASMYTADMGGHREAMVQLRERGIETFHFLGLKVHPDPLSFVGAIFRLRRILREGDYDVVETYTVTPAIAASWATRGLKARLVGGLHHAYEMPEHNGLRHKVWRFSVRSNRRARFYAISEFVRRSWIEYSRTKVALTRTVINGIPDEFFEARPAAARIALFVGSIVSYKGVDVALEALGPMLEELDLHVVFAGAWTKPSGGDFEGETGFFQSLNERIAAQGWGSRTHFLGRRDDIPRLMASSDLLIHPARIEGFGLILAEAMAAGLPVVATNVQGIPEVLEDTDAIMTPPDDPEAFRAAVVQVLGRSEEVRERCIARGRTRASLYRMERRIDSMVNLFEDAIAETEI
jgi:glycosyltransferase involved in cell wall biosynthesis